MRIKICFLVLVMGVSALQVKAQQEVQFSQYVFNGLTVNPAYAGYRGDMYLNATYRKQWVGFPGAPQTGVVSLDGLPGWANNENVGLGIQALWDRSGPQDYFSLAGSYAYRIALNDAGTSRLSFGLGMSLAQYTVDGSSLQLVNPNDPYAPIARISTLKPDASFGIYYYDPRFYVGASLLQLFAQELDNKVIIGGASREYLSIRRTSHFYFTSGYVFDIGDDFKLKPSFMIKDDFNGPTNFDLNVFALISEKIWIGGSYRSSVTIWNKKHLQEGLDRSNAASIMAEYFAGDRLRIGYSYDFTTSGLSNYQSGSHEISIGVLFPRKINKERVLSPRYF